ncbi:MAG: phosphohydrolase, partial [Deltaproteobacteria bacterium]|nr:phosphohydrolase [Deltaproteobacteria bacterium]
KDAPHDPDKLKDIIKKSFLTDAGRELAEETLLK